MRKLSAFAIVVALAGCSSAKDVTAAEDATAHFHRLLDAGKFAEIYTDASPELHRVTPEPRFVALLSAVHRKLGTVRRSDNQGWNVNYGTSGGFATLTYKTQFTAGPAQETFVYRLSKGQAQLVGYNINSDLLIIN
ncbi:MAG: DUF4019 domain-containing protein [Sphingomonadales bacterium]